MRLDRVDLDPPDPGHEREKVHLLPENQRSGGHWDHVAEEKLDWVRVGGAESHCQSMPVVHVVYVFEQERQVEQPVAYTETDIVAGKAN